MKSRSETWLRSAFIGTEGTKAEEPATGLQHQVVYRQTSHWTTLSYLKTMVTRQTPTVTLHLYKIEAPGKTLVSVISPEWAKDSAVYLGTHLQIMCLHSVETYSSSTLFSKTLRTSKHKRQLHSKNSFPRQAYNFFFFPYWNQQQEKELNVAERPNKSRYEKLNIFCRVDKLLVVQRFLKTICKNCCRGQISKCWLIHWRMLAPAELNDWKGVLWSSISCSTPNLLLLRQAISIQHASDACLYGFHLIC